MRTMQPLYALAALVITAAPARGQMLHCIDPPSAAPSEAACRIAVDPLTGELRLVLQLRAANDAPLPNWPVSFVASSGQVRDADTTDATGYVGVTWRGAVTQDPVVITATASRDGLTTRRQIRLARREPLAPAYITRVAPTGDHSAFAGRFLNDDIEVQIQADPAVCNRTKVVFEYLSVGTGAAPEQRSILLLLYGVNWTRIALAVPRSYGGCSHRLRGSRRCARGSNVIRPSPFPLIRRERNDTSDPMWCTLLPTLRPPSWLELPSSTLTVPTPRTFPSWWVWTYRSPPLLIYSSTEDCRVPGHS